MVGVFMIDTLTVVEPEQVAFVPLIVYVVFIDGVAITDEPVVVFKVNAGDHVYEEAPLTDRDAEEPAHIVADVDVNDKFAPTVTELVAELEQVPLDPITV